MSDATEHRFDGLAAAHAVLHTVQHILTVSTDLDDAKMQVGRLLTLVKEKAAEEQVPAAMLRDEGRDVVRSLL